MFTRRARLLGRTAVVASMMTLAIGALTPTSADARPLRYYGGGWHGGGWHGGGPAAAAAIAGVVGTGLAIAASRDAYAYDYGGPAYYGGGPVYYGGPAYNGYYGGHTYGNYPYQLYGGDSPYAACAQATTWNCQ
jgi:hypothetical protein